MADNSQNDKPAVFYFKVLVEGLNGIYEAAFENLSGLDVKIETETIQEGSENRFLKKLPRALQYSNLVLKKGLIADTSFMTWINKAVQNFTFEPKKLDVMLLNENAIPLVKWTFHNAYPVAVKISDPDTTENKYAIETLEIAYDYFERTDQ